MLWGASTAKKNASVSRDAAILRATSFAPEHGSDTCGTSSGPTSPGRVRPILRNPGRIAPAGTGCFKICANMLLGGTAKGPDGSFRVSKKSVKGAFSLVALRAATLNSPLPSFSRFIENLSVVTFYRAALLLSSNAMVLFYTVAELRKMYHAIRAFSTPGGKFFCGEAISM